MSEIKSEVGFSYTYSAKEREELERIREKYARSESPAEDKLQRLRRLDSKPSRQARIISVATGIVGALIMGFGMSLVMTELGASLSLSSDVSFGIGIAAGTLGALIAVAAYPIYSFSLKLLRRKAAPEIISLTDELLNK